MFDAVKEINYYSLRIVRNIKVQCVDKMRSSVLLEQTVPINRVRLIHSPSEGINGIC